MDKKEKKTRSLTEGSLWKGILLFGLPLMLSNVLQVLFNMSDIAVVGQFAGPEALGSVGSTSMVVLLFVGFLMGLGGGVNVLVAKHIGAGNKEGIQKSVHSSFIVCGIAGSIVLVLGFIFAEPILKLLHTKDELIDGAILYLKIYFIGAPATAIYNYGNAVFSAAGDTKKPLKILTFAGVLNVILNLIFVIVLKLGVAGVAMATASAQYVSAILVMYALMRTKEAYAFSFAKLCIDAESVKRLIALGIPTGCQNAIFYIANMFIQAAVNSFDAVMVEGNSAASNFDGLVYDVMAAFYVACSSYISQNYGAGRKDRIKKTYFVSLAYSFGVGAFLGGILFLLGRDILKIFTTDPAVIEAGYMKLEIMGLSYCVSAFMDNTIAASRGLGKTIFPTAAVIMGSCVFRIIWVYTIFAAFHTIPSLYLLYVFSWTLTALVEIVYFIHIYRRLEV